MAKQEQKLSPAEIKKLQEETEKKKKQKKPTKK